MSHIIVHDVSKAAQKRLARVAQIEALPPQPARHEGNHWQLGRLPFAHAGFPTMLGDRIGDENPIVKRVREQALAEGVPADEADAITLDDVLVTPDLISTTVGGRTITTLWVRRPRAVPEVSPQYKPAEYSDTEVATLFTGNLGGTYRNSGCYVYAPALLEHISITTSANVTDVGAHATLRIEPWGWEIFGDTDLGVFATQDYHLAMPFAKALLHGSAYATLDVFGPLPEGTAFMATIAIQYRPLIPVSK